MNISKITNRDPECHQTELWKDECRASITAAKITPNLTEKDKSNLVMDAIYRAQEYNHRIEIPPLYMDEIIIPSQVFFYNFKIMSGQVISTMPPLNFQFISYYYFL